MKRLIAILSILLIPVAQAIEKGIINKETAFRLDQSGGTVWLVKGRLVDVYETQGGTVKVGFRNAMGTVAVDDVSVIPVVTITSQQTPEAAPTETATEAPAQSSAEDSDGKEKKDASKNE